MTRTLAFHPAVEAWFHTTFTAPTTAQAQAWLAQGSVEVPTAAVDWVDRTVVNIAEDKVQRLQFEPTAAPALTVSKADKAAADFTLAPLPARSRRISRRRSSVSVRSCSGSAIPMSRFARWYEPGTRRRASVRECAVGRRTSSSPRPSPSISFWAPNRDAKCCRRRAPSSSTRSMRLLPTSGAATSRCRSSASPH